MVGSPFESAVSTCIVLRIPSTPAVAPAIVSQRIVEYQRSRIGGIGKPGRGSRRCRCHRCKGSGGSICLHMRRLYLLADRNVDARTSPNNQENQDHEQNCLEPGDTPERLIFLRFLCGIICKGPIDRAQRWYRCGSDHTRRSSRRGPAYSTRQDCTLSFTS